MKNLITYAKDTMWMASMIGLLSIMYIVNAFVSDK